MDRIHYAGNIDCNIETGLVGKLYCSISTEVQVGFFFGGGGAIVVKTLLFPMYQHIAILVKSAVIGLVYLRRLGVGL